MMITTPSKGQDAEVKIHAPPMLMDYVPRANGYVVQPRHMSFEEFITWCDEDTLAEWVDGDVILMSAPSILHQDVVAFLLTLLRIFSEMKQLGRVFTSPIKVKLPKRPSGRQPDLVYISKANDGRIRSNHIEGAPDLVIEVASPETVDTDRGEKLYEYENAGVAEYWLIDPMHQKATFYQLEDGEFSQILKAHAGEYQSQVLPGLKLRVEWLWQLPPVTTILREIGVLG